MRLPLLPQKASDGITLVLPDVWINSRTSQFVRWHGGRGEFAFHPLVTCFCGKGDTITNTLGLTVDRITRLIVHGNIVLLGMMVRIVLDRGRAICYFIGWNEFAPACHCFKLGMDECGRRTLAPDPS